jgi:hypothetical protein
LLGKSRLPVLAFRQAVLSLLGDRFHPAHRGAESMANPFIPGGVWIRFLGAADLHSKHLANLFSGWLSEAIVWGGNAVRSVVFFFFDVHGNKKSTATEGGSLVTQGNDPPSYS